MLPAQRCSEPVATRRGSKRFPFPRLLGISPYFSDPRSEPSRDITPLREKPGPSGLGCYHLSWFVIIWVVRVSLFRFKAACLFFKSFRWGWSFRVILVVCSEGMGGVLEVSCRVPSVIHIIAHPAYFIL